MVSPSSDGTLTPNRMSSPHATDPVSRMMRMTDAGRPYHEALIELFGTLMVSLRLTTHKHLFRSFDNTFTVDEACTNLQSIAFSQCTRNPSISPPVSTNTFKFSMRPDVARSMLQNMLDAHYIQSATDSSVITLKEKGLYTPAPKGLHVLERWIAKMGVVEYNSLPMLLETHPICVKLVQLQRRPSDNLLILSTPILHALFRRFAGARPNYIQRRDKHDDNPWARHHARSKGIPVKDYQHFRKKYKACFSPGAAHDWMCEFFSIDGQEEAVEIGANFVRLDFLSLVTRIEEDEEATIQFDARGDEDDTQGVWIAGPGVVYSVTELGRTVAGWDSDVSERLSSLDLRSNKSSTSSDFSPNPFRFNRNPSSSALSSGTNKSSSSLSTDSTKASSGTDSTRVEGAILSTSIKTSAMRALSRRRSNSRRDTSSSSAPTPPPPLPTASGSRSSASTATSPVVSAATSPSLSATAPSITMRESNVTRLRYILERPMLRALFREFLRGTWCEENLSFWLAAGDFANRFAITTSVHCEVREPTIWKPSRKQDWPGYDPRADTGSDAYVPTAQQERAYTRDQSSRLTNRHLAWLVRRGFGVYNTYLASDAETECSIDSKLRGDLVKYLEETIGAYMDRQACPPGLGSAQGSRSPVKLTGRLEARHEAAFDTASLFRLIQQFERIQASVFKTMAMDSVPKFIETPTYLSAHNQLELDDSGPEFRFLTPSEVLPPHINAADDGSLTHEAETRSSDDVSVASSSEFDGIHISVSLLAGESRAGQYV